MKVIVVLAAINVNAQLVQTLWGCMAMKLEEIVQEEEYVIITLAFAIVLKVSLVKCANIDKYSSSPFG